MVKTITYILIGMATFILAAHLTIRWYWSPERVMERKVKTWKERVASYRESPQKSPKLTATFVFKIHTPNK